MSLLSFVVSVHPTISGKPEAWSPSFAESWQTQRLSLPEILDLIKAGKAIIFAGMSSDYRSSSAFAGSQLVAVDVDHGKPIETLQGHELMPWVSGIYTTSSHRRETRSNPDGEDRFRVIFTLPRPLSDQAIYKKITTLLIAELGGDTCCSDPCRIFYGNTNAEVQFYPEALPLGEEWITRARAAIEDDKRRAAEASASLDEKDLLQAIHVLEHVLPPTEDGQRDLFIRVTASCSSVGEALFAPWSDWAARGHHGSGRNARQCSERFFRNCRGDRTSLNTLFYLAGEHDRNWRAGLPPEAKKSGSSSVSTGAAVGYSPEDFAGEDDEEYEPAGGGSYGLDASSPAPATRSSAAATSSSSSSEKGGFDLLRLREAIKGAFPELRMNLSTYKPEYLDPSRGVVQVEQDSAYIRVGMVLEGAPVLAKNTVYDIALEVARETPYHPVREYLEECEKGPAVNHSILASLATRVLGVPPAGSHANPMMAHGQSYADAVIERFLIGACARAFEPGTEHPWMPVLVGGQGVGKTSFLQALTPPQADGTYALAPVVQNGLTKLRDRPHILHSGWIVLLDEFERHCDSVNVECLKNLVSSSVDLSDRKYEHERQFPRSFVLAGAANKRTFLRDPTGNRRFKPIQVEGVIQNGPITQVDLEWIRGNRDQLWAAAMIAYRAGKTHTFGGGEEASIASAINFFTTQSPLDAIVGDRIPHVAGRDRPDGRWTLKLGPLVNDLGMSISDAMRQASAIEDAISRHGFAREVDAGGHALWIETEQHRDARLHREKAQEAARVVNSMGVPVAPMGKEESW